MGDMTRSRAVVSMRQIANFAVRQRRPFDKPPSAILDKARLLIAHPQCLVVDEEYEAEAWAEGGHAVKPHSARARHWTLLGALMRAGEIPMRKLEGDLLCARSVQPIRIFAAKSTHRQVLKGLTSAALL